MIDKDGIMGTSCDCAHLAGRNCIHSLLIERYHAEFNEPVLNGEEPTAFLVYNNYHGLLFCFLLLPPRVPPATIVTKEPL